MPNPLTTAASAAVRVLQGWYGADSYASSTGLYQWTDPNFTSDAGGSTVAGLITFYGYKDAFQDTLRWWNSANAITALIDYMLVTNDKTYLSVIAQTFQNGPNAWVPNVGVIEGTAIASGLTGLAAGFAIGLGAGGIIGGVIGGIIGGLAGFFGGGGVAAASFGRIYLTNFMNSTPQGLYDDEGWWALAWIKAYDLTGERNYLDMSVTIFNDMTNGWDNTCNGGIYWQKNQQNSAGQSPYKNAIANELFLAIAAALYLRTKDETYLSWANREWQWFSSSGLINKSIHNLINDSLTTSANGQVPCINDNSQAVWSYNQGVILGALSDMFEITKETSYLSIAESIADAFITNPVSQNGKPPESGIDPSGILTEFSDLSPNESIDNCQFKGIFVRNLAYLCTKTRNVKYSAFLRKNAQSALKEIEKSSYQFGHQWDESLDIPDFVRQTAGVDLLNAALAVQSITPDLSPLFPLLLSDARRDASDCLLLDEAPDQSYLSPLLINDARRDASGCLLLGETPDLSYLSPLLMNGTRPGEAPHSVLFSEERRTEDISHIDPLLLDDE